MREAIDFAEVVVPCNECQAVLKRRRRDIDLAIGSRTTFQLKTMLGFTARSCRGFIDWEHFGGRDKLTKPQGSLLAPCRFRSAKPQFANDYA